MKRFRLTRGEGLTLVGVVLGAVAGAVGQEVATRLLGLLGW